MVHLFAYGLSVDECAEICNADSACVAFEYGVEYPGLSGVALGACRPQYESTILSPCHHHNFDLYIKPTDPPSNPSGYQYYDRACVSGFNMVHLYASGVSVGQCAEICNSNIQCLGFEYGVDYPGRSGYSVGTCRPQSGNTLNDGCGTASLDLYLKPDVPYGYTHHANACVAYHLMLHLQVSGVSAHQCAAICNANDDCLSFEMGVDHPTFDRVNVGDCRPQSGTQITSPCGDWNLDLFIKPLPQPPLMPQPAWQPACPDPNFPFQQASGGPYCYNSASIAASNSGPCDSWCTTDSMGNGGCGSNIQKMCNVPCYDPEFPYPYGLFYTGGPFCSNDASMAAANNGPCGSWCTPDPTANLWGCGTPADLLCR